MVLYKGILDAILQECEKHIRHHQEYHNHLHIEWLRNRKRIADAPRKEVRTPPQWAIDKRFNPFYVRSNAKAIARSIAKKVSEGAYQPEDPQLSDIAKPNGGVRTIAVYQIPDAAVSLYFYNRLLAKNRHRFSSFSYAYRSDRNVHFAIQDIAVDLANHARTFIAEFDFSDFFGSIDHSYLFAQLHENGFSVSEEEEQVVRAFLASRPRGIPQGTAISLFLANLVCWRLDKSLEQAGLRFARYADDTVVWSAEYGGICKSFEIINDFSRQAGVPINAQKSEGISLLAREGLPAEIASKNTFNFLGYAMSVGRTSIREASEDRIKRHIAYLLYRNLIQPLKDHPLKGLVIPANDMDPALLVAITQIRRYLYGGLLHRDINEYIAGRRKTLHFKGVMSFYPLVSDIAQLRRLDGWIVSVIFRAIRLRGILLRQHHFDRSTSFPFNVSRPELVAQLRRRRINGKRLLEAPSFSLIFKALQRGLKELGIERVMNPDSTKYQYY